VCAVPGRGLDVPIVSHIFDHDARLRSLEITAQQVIAQPLGV
jgi:hypothetical protein